MSNMVMGLGVMALIAGLIGFTFLKGSRTKPSGNEAGDPGIAGPGWDGSHGHGHADGGGGDGGGD